MSKIECLGQCNAWCCSPELSKFAFTESEVIMIRNAGGIVYEADEGGYLLGARCPFQKGKLCQLHGKPEQPECCRDNIAGGDYCQYVRALMQLINKE